MGKQGVISLGEAFVDYISNDKRNTEYQQLLGGATVNVAVGTRRFGIPTAYLCKLGIDKTSQFVEDELRKERINTEFSVRTANKKICGVYVHINDHGDRYFHSYLNQTPDEVLTEDELTRDVFDQAKIFYFGSGTLFLDKAKKTTETAIKFAKDSQNIIAFDVNIRLKRWESEEQCRKTVSSFFEKADIVKLAEEELYFITKTNSLETGLERLAKFKIPYLFVTMGRSGACAVLNNNKVIVPAPKVNAIDTTGAGDAFMAALLYCFHEKGLPAKLSEIKSFLEFSNHVGAAATTEVGSLTAIFDLKEMNKHFQSKLK